MLKEGVVVSNKMQNSCVVRVERWRVERGQRRLELRGRARARVFTRFFPGDAGSRVNVDTAVATVV